MTRTIVLMEYERDFPKKNTGSSGDDPATRLP